jgi:hypothetical protein
VYSEQVFGDTRLYAAALAHHARAGLTLLTALDLPWQADGLQRDGAHVRAPVDALIRRALLGAGLGWSVVTGQGQARLQHALDAVTRVWTAPAAGPGPGEDEVAGQGGGEGDHRSRAHGGWRHVCVNCGDGDCERRLFALGRAGRSA